MTSNPFFETWTTPFAAPPFDRIRPDHFAPAFDEAMRIHTAEIAAIAGNDEAPSFANTIAAMERAGSLLKRVSAVFGNLVVSLGGAALQEIDLAYAPRLAQHATQIALNPALFRRVATLHDQRATLGLDPDQKRLLERTHLGFVRSGAGLGEAEKLRMAEISSRLATLHTKFGQNVLHDENEWQLVLTEGDLDGLPDFVREGAKRAAAERKADGYVITLSRSLIEPFLTFSTRRDLRRIAHAAWIARGEHPGDHGNTKLIPAARRTCPAARLCQLRGIPPGGHHGRHPGGRGAADRRSLAGRPRQGADRGRPAAADGRIRWRERRAAALGLAALRREGPPRRLRHR
jgi:peptidyl-dipeptidase Dcp